MADYRSYAKRNGVLEMPPGYDSTRQIGINTLKKMAGHYWWVLAGAGVILLLLIYGVARMLAQRRRRAA